MLINKEELYEAARAKYGIENQLNVAIEEMAELQKEICKMRRGEDNRDRLAEEIADVKIMLEQLEQFFRLGDAVGQHKAKKLIRLIARIFEDDI